MFTYIVRVKKSAVVTTLVAVVVLVMTLVLLPAAGQAVPAMGGQPKAPRCSTNEERVAWLTELGWQVEAQPTSSLSVVIPEKFDELYAQYAVLQRQSGFHLEKQKGKTAQKFTYQVLNYGDGTEAAMVSILQCGDKIIAADLSSARLGGFLKALLPRSQTVTK